MRESLSGPEMATEPADSMLTIRMPTSSLLASPGRKRCIDPDDLGVLAEFVEDVGRSSPTSSSCCPVQLRRVMVGPKRAGSDPAHDLDSVFTEKNSRNNRNLKFASSSG